MKKLFKKSLAVCLMAALVLSAMMGAMVVSAEGVVAAKGALTGNIAFGYNTKINFEPVDGATAYGAEVYRTDKGEGKAVDVVFDSINKAVVGISNISLNNINKTFTFKPYAVVEEVKVYAETFTSSYAEWLVSRKDGEKFNAEVNNILDTYAAVTGETVYEGQEIDLEAAPAIGEEDKWVATEAGNAEVKGSFNTAEGKNALQVGLGVEYPQAPNYFPAGDFENFTSNGNITVETNPNTASNAWKLPANKWVGTGTPITVKANTQYKIELKAWLTGNIYFRMSYNAEPSSNEYSGSATYSTGGIHYNAFNGATGYQELTVTFTTGSSTELYMSAYQLAGGTYIDDITVREAGAEFVEPALNNGFDSNALYYEWIGQGKNFTGVVGTYDGGKTAYGRNPIDNSITWAWLSGNDISNGTKFNIEANTYYTFSADIYVPQGKTIGFAIHNGDAYNNIDNDSLVTSRYYESIDNGSWRSISWIFYSGEHEGQYWLTITNGGNFTGTAVNSMDNRVRYDSVKIMPVLVSADVYKPASTEADATVMFGSKDTLAVSISNISFANLAKQYKVVPYVANENAELVAGEEVVASYADFLAHALNNGNDGQKAIAYAIVKAYKAAYGVDLVKVQGPVNLIVNGSFEEGITGWKTGKTWEADNYVDWHVVEGEEATDGTHYIEACASNTAKFWQWVELESNTNYKLSVDVYCDDSGWDQVRLELGNENRGVEPDGGTAIGNQPGTDGQWTTFTYSFNSGSNTWAGIRMTVSACGEVPSKYDNFKLIAQ